MDRPSISTFGIFPTDVRITTVQQELGLTPDASGIIRLARSIRRDLVLTDAGGRWLSGQPDPTTYGPGDVPAVRSIPCGPLLDYLTKPNVNLDLLANALLGASYIYTAKPFFLDATALAAVVATEAPPPELIADIRLPFPRVLVVFGADLVVDQTTWPPRMHRHPYPPGMSLFRYNIEDAIIERGGASVCAVLLNAQDEQRCQGLRDICCWMVSADPDPTMPPPSNYDRQRGILLGTPSLSELAPLLHNLALVVSSAVWRAVPQEIPSIGEPDTERWARSLQRHRARQAILAGAGTGVHVLDMVAIRHASASHPKPTGRHLKAHPRRGHWRRSRVATRNPDGQIVGNIHGEHGPDWRYVPHWIPPAVVGRASGQADSPIVWRLTAPNQDAGHLTR